MSLQPSSERIRALPDPWLIHCLVLTQCDQTIGWHRIKPITLTGFRSNPCDHAEQQMPASQAVLSPHQLRRQELRAPDCKPAAHLLDESIVYVQRQHSKVIPMGFAGAKRSFSRKAQLVKGDGEMTGTSDAVQASTSCGERDAALAVEPTEDLSSRNSAASAPLRPPVPSSRPCGRPPRCVAALTIARTAVAKGVARAGVLRIHDRCSNFPKSVQLPAHSLRRILNHILAHLRDECPAFVAEARSIM